MEQAYYEDTRTVRIGRHPRGETGIDNFELCMNAWKPATMAYYQSNRSVLKLESITVARRTSASTRTFAGLMSR